MKIHRYFTSALGVACCAVMGASDATTADDWPIVERRGDKLFEGEREFRFLGLAAPNLHQNESQLHADHSNRFPDEYEIRDVLDSLRRLGARATRTFSLSIASPDDGGTPRYITGHREYNEEAFATLDLILALCPEYDVRVIIPFIASQRFKEWRGVDEFSLLSGKEPGSFWTDEMVKADFRHFLDFILNRKNTVSGILYKDDPAVLAWQFGNEFSSYAPDRGLSAEEWETPITDWCIEMAAYIKSVDAKHLILEAGGDRARFLADPNIDIISTHLYEYWNRLAGLPYELGPLAEEEWAECEGVKPLMVDEFGLGTFENVSSLIRTIRESGISGGLLWSIRGHRRDGGFYYHNEGGTPVNSFHVPGFAVSHDYDEIRTLDLIRKEGWLIRDESIPPIEKPLIAPVLMKAGDGLVWRGSTGARYYEIERASSANGPWEKAAVGLADSVVSNVTEYESSKEAAPVPLWYDLLRPENKTVYYRVRGFNEGGSSEYSNVLEWGSDSL